MDLTIPEFLRRVPGTPSSVSRSTPKRKKRIPRKGEWVRLHLGDEFPRIGSGCRVAQVLTRGRKWITVRYWPGGPNGHHINQRIENTVFEKHVR